MKRWIALCLSLLLLAALAACGQVSDMDQKTEEDSGAAEIGTNAKTGLDAVTVSTADVSFTTLPAPMVFSDKYCDRHCDTTREMPEVEDEDVSSETTFTFVIADAPATGAAPAMMGEAASVSAPARQQVVMRNDL